MWKREVNFLFWYPFANNLFLLQGMSIYLGTLAKYWKYFPFFLFSAAHLYHFLLLRPDIFNWFIRFSFLLILYILTAISTVKLISDEWVKGDGERRKKAKLWITKAVSVCDWYFGKIYLYIATHIYFLITIITTKKIIFALHILDKINKHLDIYILCTHRHIFWKEIVHNFGGRSPCHILFYGWDIIININL